MILFKPGDKVINRSHPEWGTGAVIEYVCDASSYLHVLYENIPAKFKERYSPISHVQRNEYYTPEYDLRKIEDAGWII